MDIYTNSVLKKMFLLINTLTRSFSKHKKQEIHSNDKNVIHVSNCNISYQVVHFYNIVSAKNKFYRQTTCFH